MPADPPSQRLLRLLRRTSKGGRAAVARSPIDDGALWSAHERALVRARDAAAAAQRIAARRGDSASRSTRSRRPGPRARRRARRELQAAFARVVDAFERLGLVALNAGLEGARLGEAEGRQLALVSDEVRAQSLAGRRRARELARALGAARRRSWRSWRRTSAQAQVVVAEVTQDAARAAGAASDAEAALARHGRARQEGDRAATPRPCGPSPRRASGRGRSWPRSRR